VRSVLVCDTESLAVHAGLLVHVDSLLWLLCVNETLFSLAEVASLQLEFSLVEEHLVD